MNVEIGAEAALFPEKEYINGIAVAVQSGKGGRDKPSCEDLTGVQGWDNSWITKIIPVCL
jgi:hypothetical protein